MKGFLNLDHPIWKFIGRIIDVFVLHIFWVICCVPIITIGPATAALYYSLMKDIEDEEGHYAPLFFKSFKENFKQGILITLILLVSGILLAFSHYFYYKVDFQGVVWMILQVILYLFTAAYIMTITYVFPLFARFNNSITQLFRNSFFMSIRHFGWTIVMILIFSLVYFIALYLQYYVILLLGFGIVAYLDTYIINHILKAYTKDANPHQ